MCELTVMAKTSKQPPSETRQIVEEVKENVKELGERLPEKEKAVISTKQLATIITIFIGALSLIGTIHATLVVPAILSEASDMVDRKIDAHAGRPHQGAISREEFNLVMQQLAKLATVESVNSLSRQIDRLDHRLATIERK